MPTTSTIIDGRYRVVRRVGSGGMADVFCAEDLQLGRNVALKLLHRRFAEDAEFVERFRREASSAAGLQHPHVVSVYDRGEWDGTYYIAMEYLEGRTLKRVIVDEAPLDPSRATDLTIQILRAARFAHKRGIIHRDLKPHNVIVDDEGRAKVTDFGIARAGASDMTQTGSIMGTAQYLSPEQAQGHAVHASSDLYSIGIILYEMLTGRVPFDGESAVTIALKQVSETPEPPSRFNAAVSPALEAVVMRALEKDPHRRFADADEFISALEHAGAAPQHTAGITALAPAAGVAAAYAATDATSVAPPPVYGEEVVVEDRGPLPPDEGGGSWWIALLIGLLVTAALLFFLLRGSDKVEVPNVVGNPEPEATLVLKRKGFSTDIVNKESADRPKGTVIGQDPAGGSRADKGSTVTLVVSAGPGTARVPEVEGEGRNTAAKELEKLGLNVEEVEQFDDTVGTDRVIETRPAAGTELEKGSTVTLVVSKGKERLGVPGVVGQTEEDARTTLEDAGFRVSTKEQESEDKDPGTVLAQDPDAGTRLPKGSTVTLTVAKEPADVAVPDVVGKDQADATDQLSGDGFRVSTEEQEVTTPDDDGKVLKQDPSGGRAKKGSRVTITVGRFNPDLNPDPGAGQTTTTPGGTGGADGTTTTP
ncbi:MAG: Stk1 family PASTA domain-containing Ser/Thr kinase [Solirubrobacterales bacterium]|nr:Stk1 family PASTA domain-containing Ser/Thr kinase [Solirubrobacterales bacterium]